MAVKKYAGGAIGFGERSITKVRPWISWYRPNAARNWPGVCSASCLRSMASPPSRSRLISCVPMARPFERSGYRSFTIKASGQTIGQRIQITRCGGEIARRSGSSRPDQPNASFQSKPPFKTSSPSNATSCHAVSSSSSGRPRLRSGGNARRPPEHADVGRSLRLTALTCQCRQWAVRHSEWNLLLKALMNPLSVGFPGRKKSRMTSFA